MNLNIEIMIDTSAKKIQKYLSFFLGELSRPVHQLLDNSIADAMKDARDASNIEITNTKNQISGSNVGAILQQKGQAAAKPPISWVGLNIDDAALDKTPSPNYSDQNVSQGWRRNP